MKKTFLFFLILIFFIEGCSVKKEVKTITTEKCGEIVSKIKNLPTDNNIYKITGIIKGKGFLYALFKGYINDKYKISFYTPFGKKIYDIESPDKNIICIKDKRDIICIDKSDFYKVFLKIDIPFNLKEIILGKYNLKDINDYICKNDEVIFKRKNEEYIYSLKGKIKNLKFNKYQINYHWEGSKSYPALIQIYENGKYKLKLKIKTLKKVEE